MDAGVDLCFSSHGTWTEEPVPEIDEQWKKVFQIYHFSLRMMLDVEDLAELQQKDFTHLGVLTLFRSNKTIPTECSSQSDASKRND